MTRKFILLLFISILLNINLSANTEAINFGTFNGSADLRNIDNGTISSDGKTCQVNVNAGAAGATLTWSQLGVPQGKTLNFYFHDASQYALNKVTGAVPTYIAGNIGYAAGSQAGTVIISNPTGIVVSGTANINLGSLLLTTHDVNVNNNILELTKKTDIKKHYDGISIEKGATLNLSKNLTIASLV